MTVPFERARAVRQTQKFLIELSYSESTPDVPERIRKQAVALLRHYPTLSDIKLVESGWKEDNIIECPFATKDDLFGELK